MKTLEKRHAITLKMTKIAAKIRVVRLYQFVKKFILIYAVRSLQQLDLSRRGGSVMISAISEF